MLLVFPNHLESIHSINPPLIAYPTFSLFFLYFLTSQKSTGPGISVDEVEK